MASAARRPVFSRQGEKQEEAHARKNFLQDRFYRVVSCAALLTCSQPGPER